MRTILRTAFVSFSLFAIAAVAPAHMPAAAFLKKADALRARGPLALLSPELKHLQSQAEGAGDELHKEHAAALSAGRSSDYCSPISKYLTPRELITGLHAIPQQELERMDIKQAMHAIFERNYPCQKTASR